MNLSDLLKLWRVEKGAADLAKMPPQFYNEARELLEGNDKYEVEKARGIYNDLVYMRQHKMLMGSLRQMRGGDKPENLLSVEKETYTRIYAKLVIMRDGRVEAIEPETVPAETDNGQETLGETETGTKVRKDLDEVAPALEEPAEEKEARKKREHEHKKGELRQEDVFKGKTENKALKRVRFLRPMPTFIGPDLQTLGPFDEDQVSELDGEIVEILLKNDAVELM